ncbi:lipopolysaccharide assembly protein LapA domain-containing protein [Marinomonas sp. IMCC 4694]|uniref:lipopolysaccharide assembly protein LapA domain-containing protein n=1 Tax=Marinomonas sp. IMCC 4694 TaxID=2605432 RepID=UPI0011E6465F|nr:LapA family protein [Marinomonas sp. IMCC 4694]TYL48433.1 LapA family protein [Marinomonas sp. IMCC 4694]
MIKWLKRIVYTVFIVFFLALGVFFAIRNPQIITLDLVLWRGPKLSVALYIILSFSIGACVALLVSSVALLRNERQIRVLTRRYEKARDEVDGLRKASITKELSVGKE